MGKVWGRSPCVQHRQRRRNNAALWPAMHRPGAADTVLRVTLEKTIVERFKSERLADLVSSLNQQSQPDSSLVTFVRVGVDTDNEHSSGKSDLCVIVGVDTDPGEVRDEGVAEVARLEPAASAGGAGVDHLGRREPDKPGSRPHPTGEQR